MTVSSMGMFATGVCSFLVCKVFKLSETVADSQVGLRGGQGSCCTDGRGWGGGVQRAEMRGAQQPWRPPPTDPRLPRRAPPR